MRLREISYLFAFMLIAFASCSKDEPEQEKVYGDVMGAWEYMIASEDGREVSYYEPLPIDGFVVADPKGDVLKLKLGERAYRRRPLDYNNWAVTEYDFRCNLAMELDASRENAYVAIGQREKEWEAYLTGNSESVQDDVIERSEDNRFVRTSSTTFTSRGMESRFEIEIGANTTGKDRVIYYVFDAESEGGMDYGHFGLVICQAAVK